MYIARQEPLFYLALGHIVSQEYIVIIGLVHSSRIGPSPPQISVKGVS